MRALLTSTYVLAIIGFVSTIDALSLVGSTLYQAVVCVHFSTLSSPHLRWLEQVHKRVRPTNRPEVKQRN